MITYSEYEPYILRNLGRSDSTTSKLVMDSLNTAQQFLAAQQRWKSLSDEDTFTLYTGAFYYTLDELYLTDLQHIYSLKLHDGTRYWPPLKEVTAYQWDNTIAPYIHTSTGRPQGFCMYGDIIYFDRYSDADYTATIRFQYKPQWITTSLDEINFQDSDAALIALSTCLTWLALEETENAKIWLETSKGLLRSAELDWNKLFNFRTFTKASETAQAQPDYWKDPFRRRV